MFGKFFTKYGLAFHLALLAAVPVAIAPFVSAATTARVIFWLAPLAAVWLYAEPSLRHGEHLSDARARVTGEILRDPITYFLLIAGVFALIRWFNVGIALWYDGEAAMWTVRPANFDFLPGSAGDAGRLPFAVALAGAVVVLGLRHALGRKARQVFGIVASFLVGASGLAAACCACAGFAPFRALSLAGFEGATVWGLIWGCHLMLAVGAGIEVEGCKWGFGRLPFAFAVGGNAAGVVFFAPSYVMGVFMVLFIVYALYCIVYASHVQSKGACARSASFILIGLALPIFLLMAWAPAEVYAALEHGFDFEQAFPESWREAWRALSRMAREAWGAHPWCGIGLGGFALHAPFLAEKADWSVISNTPKAAMCGYATLLVERGIVGCGILATGAAMLVWSWVSRLISGFAYVLHSDETDTPLFACRPLVWSAPLAVIPFFVAYAFTPAVSPECAALAVGSILAVSASSFPLRSASESGEENVSARPGESGHHKQKG